MLWVGRKPDCGMGFIILSYRNIRRYCLVSKICPNDRGSRIASLVKKNPKNPWFDHYAERAKKEGYPARSVYKLEEIHKRFRLFRQEMSVLDLGCAPGSWLLYAARQVGGKGRAVGLDRNPVAIALPKNARSMAVDIFELSEHDRELLGGGYDVVLSDMAPDTTGFRDVDAIRSAALCEAALNLACEVLKPGGGFVCKIFQGEGFDAFFRLVKNRFSGARLFKPEACRKESREIYIIASGKKSDVKTSGAEKPQNQ